MSVASRITQIEEHLRDIYDTLEIAGEDLTNINKNIININVSLINRLKDYLANGIDIVWENWEKIEEEGTKLSLVDTIAGEMKISYKGNTYQETTTGKNLLQITSTTQTVNGVTFTLLPDGTIKANGTAGTNGINYYVNSSFNLEAGTYTLSDGVNATDTTYFTYANGIGLETRPGIHTKTITQTTNCAVRIVIRQGVTLNNVIFKPMIEKSSSATTFEKYTGGIASPNPSYPQTVQTITGRQQISISNGNVTNTYEVNLGKNLFDSSTIVAGDIIGRNTTIRLCSKQNVWIEPGTYTFSTNMISPFRYTIGFNSVGSPPLSAYPTYSYETGWQTTASTTFTITTGGYLSVQFGKNNNATLTVDEVKAFTWQLEKGSQATSYSPYKTPIELCKIGNYQDYIFKNTTDSDYYDSSLEEGAWYLHKEIGKVVLNGGFISAGVSNVFYSTAITDYATSNNIPYSNQYAGVSNVMGGSNMGSQANNTVAFINQSGLTTPRFYIKDTRYSNQNDLNTWLSSHNVSVYYVLDTPTTELIEDTELLGQLNSIDKQKSFDEQTNIIATSDDLQIIMNVVALKDLT